MERGIAANVSRALQLALPTSTKGLKRETARAVISFRHRGAVRSARTLSGQGTGEIFLPLPPPRRLPPGFGGGTGAHRSVGPASPAASQRRPRGDLLPGRGRSSP